MNLTINAAPHCKSTTIEFKPMEQVPLSEKIVHEQANQLVDFFGATVPAWTTQEFMVRFIEKYPDFPDGCRTRIIKALHKNTGGFKKQSQ